MEQQNITSENKERPFLLTTLCILTFIWSGLMTLLSLIGIIASSLFVSFFEKYVPGMGGTISSYFAIIMGFLFILWGLSLWGAIKMFCLKKSGYVLYMIPNCFMLLFQVMWLYIAFTVFSLFFLLVSILFIVLYGINLKYMK